jgi:hypothetical protein
MAVLSEVAVPGQLATSKVKGLKLASALLPTVDYRLPVGSWLCSDEWLSL